MFSIFPKNLHEYRNFGAMKAVMKGAIHFWFLVWGRRQLVTTHNTTNHRRQLNIVKQHSTNSPSGHHFLVRHLTRAEIPIEAGCIYVIVGSMKCFLLIMKRQHSASYNIQWLVILNHAQIWFAHVCDVGLLLILHTWVRPLLRSVDTDD